MENVTSHQQILEIKKGDTFFVDNKPYTAATKCLDEDPSNECCRYVMDTEGNRWEVTVQRFPLDRTEEIEGALEYLMYHNWRKTKEGPRVMDHAYDYLKVLFDPNSTTEQINTAFDEYWS